MSNKERLKHAIEQDFNCKSYYDEIMNQIKKREEKMQKKSNLWKGVLVPICLIGLISSIVFFNTNKEFKTNVYQPDIEAKDNVHLYINDISKMTQEVLSIDADVKITHIENILYFKEIAQVKIPSDFDYQEAHEIYTKPDRESNEYSVLQSYVFNYRNQKNDRDINVSFSKENKPIRDYYFSLEGSKISEINNIELKIFKYNELFFTEFNYKGINFDIETTNITEQELTDLLVSILK